MDPRELRRIRLESEHKELMRLNGSIIEIVPEGPAPFSKYRITFHIRTFISSAPRYRDSTECVLTIPSDYPQSAPALMCVSSPPPYHVNWFTSGRWCYGHWDVTEPLASYVLRAARTLRNDPELVNVNSPANSAAIPFWHRVKDNSRLVPCDQKNLPVLSTPEAITIHNRPRPVSGTIVIKEREPSGTIELRPASKPTITIFPKADD